MRAGRIQLKGHPDETMLPTANEQHRGQVRVLSGDGSSTADALYYARDNAGTVEWARVAHEDEIPDTAAIDAHIAATAAHGATGAVVGTTNTQTLTNKTLTTPTIGSFTNAQHTHANAAGGGQISHTALTSIGTNSHATIDAFISDVKATTFITRTASGVVDSEFALNSLSAGTLAVDGSGNLASVSGAGLQMPPFFFAANTSTSAAPASNQTNALYLGQAPKNLTSVVVRMNVTTAYVAGTWAEVGIGTSSSVSLNGGATITRSGVTDVAATFNSTGAKSTTISVAVTAGQHVWLLWGSQGGTAYAVTGGVADALTAGFTQFRAATRISTMAANSVFTASASATLAAWAAFQWS